MKKKSLLLIILLMAVGFAAVSTTLFINGQTNIAANQDDFNVYYSDAYVNGVQDKSVITSDTVIEFETTFDKMGQKYILDYEVTNGSKNYDAELEMVCTGGNEYLTVTNNFDDETVLQAKKVREGKLTIEQTKSYIGDDLTVTIECIINANAIERTSLGVTDRSQITVEAVDKNDKNLNAKAYQILGNEETALLDSLVETGYVTDSSDIDALVEVKSDVFEDFATTTFDVSSIAEEGDKVVILHFNDSTQEWEYISEEIVDENGEVTADFTSYSPVAFVVVTGNGSLEKLVKTVTFDVNGGESSEKTRIVTINSLIGELPIPTRTGYTFQGWYTEKINGEKIDSNKKIVENITIYAQWNANKYTVNFDANSGTVETISKEITYDEEYGELPIPTKDGYTFKGWYLEDKLVESTTIVNQIENHTLTAKWGTNDYTVTLDANGGVFETKEITVTYDSEYGELGTPSREGYDFDGWYIDNTKIESTTKVKTSKDHTIKAKWNAKEYLVILNPNGGSITIDEVTVTYDREYGNLGTPSRTGYTFEGWYTAIDGGEKVENTTIVKLTNTQNLYAQWNANEYTINFDTAGGIVGETSKKVTYDETYGELVTPSKTGYTFQGWYLNNIKVESATKVSITSDSTLIASWKANDYSLKFEANGGTVDIVGKNVTYGAAVGSLPTPARTGYTFKGWYTEITGGTKYDSTTKVTFTDELTLYAQWTANKYTLKFNANGGESSETSRSVTYDSAVGELPTPTRTGYTFQGWYTEPTGGIKYDSTTKVIFTDETTVYAQWTANGYTLKFDANNGSVSETSRNVTYGSVVGTLPTPSRTGYTFAGWYTATSGGTKYESTTVVAFITETTLYARWTANKYTVNYNGNGNTGGSTASSTHTYDVAQNLTANGYTKSYAVTFNANGGSVSTTSANATYTFSGWATSSTGSVVHTDKKSVTNLSAANGATVNLYAIWTGGKLSSLPTPTRTGYTFNGWYTAASGGTKITTSTVFTQATTLYAQWTVNSYTLKFNANGGSVNETSRSVTYGTAVGTLPTPTRTNYKFLGWYTAASGGTKYEATTTVTFTSETTLYAQWDYKTFEVGELVTVAGDTFNVMKDNGTSLTMMATYALDGSYRQSSGAGGVIFTESTGWAYTPGPKEINVQTYATNPKTYINGYVSYLRTQTGDSSISVDLPTVTQLGQLGCTISANYSSTGTCVGSPYQSWLVNGQHYWTKSALSTSSTKIFEVRNNGPIQGADYGWGSGGYSCVRPVITINKSTIIK